MRRRLILASALAAMTVSMAAPAAADPSVCLELDIDLNGEVVIDEATCLPPTDSGLATQSLLRR